MPPKKSATEADFVPACNTLVTNGFHLLDLDSIRASFYSAVKMFAQDRESITTFPNRLLCSHCNEVHELTPDEINTALFLGPGAVDFVATYNELFAILKNEPVVNATHEFGNGETIQLASVLDGATTLAQLYLDGAQVPQDGSPAVLGGNPGAEGASGEIAGEGEGWFDLGAKKQESPETIDLNEKDSNNETTEGTDSTSGDAETSSA